MNLYIKLSVCRYANKSIYSASNFVNIGFHNAKLLVTLGDGKYFDTKRCFHFEI